MISVIIPTFNSARALQRTLPALVDGVGAGVVRQVVIADGGSSDDTLAMAEAAGCDVVMAENRRAKQMRAGAEASKGKYVFFLYPGTMLRAGWIEELGTYLNTPQSRAKAAVFRLAFDDPSPQAKRAAFWARMRAKHMKVPYGEQGLLMSRFFYDGLGGYPDVAAMEDVEIARRIGAGRWIEFTTEAVTPYRAARAKSALTHVILIARCKLGGDPVELAKAYG